MSNSKPRVDRSSGARSMLAWALLAAAADIAAAWLLAKGDLEAAARLLVALMPVPLNLVVIVLVVKAIRRLEEFQRRLHFEAVAMAFVSTGLGVLMYGFLQKAQFVGPLNVGLVWVPMTVLYCVGYAVAARHYK